MRIINIATLEDNHLISGPETSVSWSPTGEWIAYSPNDIYIIRPDGSEKWQLTDNQLEGKLYGWSEDGQKVLYWLRLERGDLGKEGTWQLKVVDIDSMEEWAVARFTQPLESWDQLVITNVNTLEPIRMEMPGEPEDVLVVQFFWTPDFHHFAILTAKAFGTETFNTTKLYLLDVECGQVQTLNTTGFLLASDVPQSRGGTLLTLGAQGFDESSAEQFQTYLLDITTGETRVLSQELGQFLWMPSWSPDETLISFMDTRDRIVRVVYDFDTRETTRLPDTFVKWYWPLYWSPRLSYGPGACQESQAGK